MRPSYQGIRATYKDNAKNEDIRQAIVVAVPKATEQMAQMAKRFQGETEKQTCENIFNFLLHNIRYKADGENQIIRFPSALLHSKTGDCKSYSLFTAAVLNNLNIPCHFVLQSFGQDPTPSHIYCATNNEVKIDAVYKKFNQEKTPTFKYIIPVDMKVTHMAGIGNTCSPIGDTWVSRTADKGAKAVKQAANYVKEEVEDLNLKSITLAIPRQIFLGLFSLNVDGMASKIQKQGSQARWEQKWISYGGNAQALSKAIRDGAGRSEKRLGFLSAIERWIKKKVGLNGIGATADQNAMVKNALSKEPLKSQWNEIVYGAMAATSETVSTLVGAPGVGTASSPVLSEMILKNTDSIIDMIFPIQPGADITKNADSPAVGKGGGFIPKSMRASVNEVQKQAESKATQAESKATQAESKATQALQESAKKSKNTALIIGGVVALAGIVYMTTKKSKSKK